MKEKDLTPKDNKLGGLENKLRALIDTPNLGTGDELRKNLKKKYSGPVLGPEDINEGPLV